MQWTPDEVRALSLSDFAAAVEGFRLFNGHKPELRQDDLDELDALMAKYPDQVH